MRIVVIHGSMRRGNTYALVQEVVGRLLAKPDMEVSEFSVSGLMLPFCLSCHRCFVDGEEHCPHYAITGKLAAALEECDGAILSGTTYMWSLNAAMKNLLDHFAYLFHRPSLFGKIGMVVTTSAGAGEKGVARYMKSVLGQWGINGAIVVTQNEKAHSLGAGGDGLSAKEAERVDRATERFCKAIKSKRLFSPSAKAISVHNAFRAMSLSGYSKGERDRAHWSQSGFFDRAYPVKASPMKYLLGTLVFMAAKAATALAGRVG